MRPQPDGFAEAVREQLGQLFYTLNQRGVEPTRRRAYDVAKFVGRFRRLTQSFREAQGMATERTRVLMIGANGHPEFAAAAEWLARRAELTVAESVPIAEQLFQRSNPSRPELVLLCQPRPGEIPFAHLERLRRRAPSARVATLLGSWCEGEARSGRPWPGIERIYWHDWQPRLTKLLAPAGRRGKKSGADDTGTIAAPSDVDMFLATNSPNKSLRGAKSALRVGICSQSAVAAESLADAVRAAGWDAVLIASASQIDSALSASAPAAHDSLSLAIWDGTSMTESEANRLRSFSQHVSPAPVLAVLGFPRWDDRELALASGAKEILAKPFRLEDFVRVGVTVATA